MGTHPGDGIVSPLIPANTSQKCLAGEGITTAPLRMEEGGAPLGTHPGDGAVAGNAHDLYAQGWIYFQNALSAYYIRDGIKLELIKEGPVWVLPPETHTRAYRGRDATGIDPVDPGAVKGQPKENTEEIPVIIDPVDPGAVKGQPKENTEEIPVSINPADPDAVKGQPTLHVPKKPSARKKQVS